LIGAWRTWTVAGMWLPRAAFQREKGESADIHRNGRESMDVYRDLVEGKVERATGEGEMRDVVRAKKEGGSEVEVHENLAAYANGRDGAARSRALPAEPRLPARGGRVRLPRRRTGHRKKGDVARVRSRGGGGGAKRLHTWQERDRPNDFRV